MNRPVSVWFVMILLSLAGMGILLGLFVWTPLTFAGLWGSTRSPNAVGLFLLIFAIGVGLLGLIVLTIVLIAKGRPKGRLLGLAALIIVFAFGILSKLNPTPPGRGLPRFELNAYEQNVARFLDIASVVAFGMLFVRFGFGGKSRRFFSPPVSVTLAGSEGDRQYKPELPSIKVESPPLVKCPECGAPTFDLAHHRHIQRIPDRR